MPNFRKRWGNKVFGWKDGDSFYLSLLPKDNKAAKNAYASPGEALSDAHARGMQIQWEDIAAIDAHGK